MSFGEWLKKQKDGYQEINDFFKLGCEVLGPPQGQYGMGSPLERADRIRAGRKEAARRNAKREANRGKASYGQNSSGGSFGSSSYSMKSGTYRGYPSLSRVRDSGVIDVFYGDNLDLNDPLKGHDVVGADGKVISHRPAGSPR